MSQPSRRPLHPVVAALFGAVVATAAIISTQKATQPPPVVFSGHRTQPLVIRQPGTYTFPAGAEIDIDPARTRQGVIACLIHANRVVLENLTTEGGFRGISFGGCSHVTLRHCTARHAGYQRATPGGGSCFFGDNCSDITLEDCQGLDPAGEHALYAAETQTGVTVRRDRFESHQSKYPVVQLNAEGGSGIRGALIEDTTILAATPGSGALNVDGAGFANDPVLFRRCQVSGESGLVAWNGPAHRNAYVSLQDTSVNCKRVAVEVQAGSHVWKRGATRIVGTIKGHLE
jgi:hypothetical protein